MTGEDVRIRLKPDDYDVDATFTFYNEGKSTSVLVGFPMDGWSPGDHNVGEFKAFKTYVDGKEVQTINQYETWQGDGMPGETKWKLKRVSFDEGSTTVTRVVYTAPYGEFANNFRFVSYVIGTGSSWYGNIGRSTFTIVFDDNCNLEIDNKNHPFAEDSPMKKNKITFRRTGKNEMSWYVNEFKPHKDEVFNLNLYTDEYMPWETAKVFYYDLDITVRPVKESILDTLSLKQLRILQNEIYARHGKVFEDDTLREYFSCQTRYKPKDGFSESELNAIEKQNVEIINAYIKKLTS
jgi:hypothetical protein